MTEYASDGEGKEPIMDFPNWWGMVVLVMMLVRWSTGMSK